MPAAVVAGATASIFAADTSPGDTLSIPANTTVVSTTGTTVTLSASVTNLNNTTYMTSAATAAGNAILHFSSLPPGLVAGASVTDTSSR